MANRTIGIEIEMYIFEDDFENYLETIGDNPTAAYGTFVERYQAVDRVLKKIGCPGWQGKDDGSLDAEEIDGKPVFAVEVITPPLTWEQVKVQIPLFYKTFMQFGTAEDPTCGLHVHIDVSDLISSPSNEDVMNKLMMMMLHFKSAEPVFDRMVAAHRKKSEYAESVDFTKLVNRYSNAIFQLSNKGKLEHVIDSLGENRYAKFNILSLHKQPTVEFRQHEGTDSAQKVLLWVSNCLNFINVFTTAEKVFEGFLSDARKIIQSQQKTNIGKEGVKDVRTETLQEITKFIAQRIGFSLRNIIHEATKKVITRETNGLVSYIQKEMLAKKKRVEIDLSKILTPQEIQSVRQVYQNEKDPEAFGSINKLKNEFTDTSFIVYPFSNPEWLRNLYQAEYRSVIFRRYGHTATPDGSNMGKLARNAAAIAGNQNYQPIKQLQEAIEELANLFK